MTEPQHDKLQWLVLCRYVAQAALVELPTTCGYGLRAVSQPDVLARFAQSAIAEACSDSKLLKSHYHASEVAKAQADILARYAALMVQTPNMAHLLIDQLAFYGLRVLGSCQLAVTDELAARDAEVIAAQ